MNWKEDLLIREDAELIENPYTQEKCLLVPEAVAVYDFIKGCEYLANLGSNVVRNSKLMGEALLYFQEKWPEEYLKLLD